MQSENTLVDAMFEKPEPAKVGIADKDSDVSQVLYRKSDGEEEERPKWMDAGCPNSLKALYEFHCGKVLDKAAVEIFMSAKSLSEIRERYQVCFFWSSSVRRPLCTLLFSVLKESFILQGAVTDGVLGGPVRLSGWAFISWPACMVGIALSYHGITMLKGFFKIWHPERFTC